MSPTAALEFAHAAAIYWPEVFPIARRERRHWSDLAETIPDPELRRDAGFTLATKWGHAEGAAVFATLVPRRYRRQVARMTIAYQSIVDFLDTTSERRVDDPYANTFRLHQALFAALGLEPEEAGDRYEHHARHEDGGFLAAQIAVCRDIFVTLPSAHVVVATARRFANLYAEAQGLCHSIEVGSDESAKAKLTQAEARRQPEMQWGEMIAAGSSSLPALTMLALAGKPGLSEQEVALVQTAYYPWISALHILLHGVVDQPADLVSGQFNQLNHYGSPAEAAERVAAIASRARQLSATLPQGAMHEAILAGMAGYYLAPREAWSSDGAPISRRALESLGPLVRASLLVHHARRRLRPRPEDPRDDGEWASSRRPTA